MKRLQRVIVGFLAVLFCQCCFVDLARADYETRTVAHDIAIAYDNSGSMYEDQRWSNAKYALEVLTAMMDNEDTLTIYTMDQYDAKLQFSGSEPPDQRVATVHNTDYGMAVGTLIDPSRSALECLKGSSADERYLIIMTDGVFNMDGGEPVSTEDGLQRIQQIAQAASTEGITTIYMAIGEQAIAITPDTSKHIYLKKTVSSNILDTMLEIANQVYGRSILPQEYWNAETGELHFDIPMSKIVVLAQGQSAMVGSLTGSNGKMDGSHAEVSWSHVGDEPENLANKNLHGEVAIFQSEMASGDYKLDVSGADSIAIYYLPFADIVTKLVNDDGGETLLEPDVENNLPAGDYTVSMRLLDPFTGNEIDSPMIDNAICAFEMEHDGTTSSYAEGDKVSFETGETSLRATAELPAGVRIFQSYDGVRVTPKGESLLVDASGAPGEAHYDADGPERHPEGRVVVTKANGEEITSDEWSLMELSADSADGMTWEIKKSDTEVGVFSVTAKDLGAAPAGLDWLRVHVFPFLPGGLARRTDFVAQVKSDLSDLEGTTTLSVRILGAFLWWLLAIILLTLAAIITLIHLYRTRPRLPELNPAIDVGGRKGVCPVVSDIKRSLPLNPLLPERASFYLCIDELEDEKLSHALRLDKIGLVAVKPENSKLRYAQVDEETRQVIIALNDESQPIPANCDAVSDDDEKRPEMLGKDSTITITGPCGSWNKPRTRRGAVTNYTIHLCYRPNEYDLYDQGLDG